MAQSEARLRGVLDGMTEAFCLLAADFTIMELNAEALRIDGRSRDDILGRVHWEVYPGSEDSELGHLLKRAMAERVCVSLEHNFRWDNGRARWLDMRAYPTSDGALAVFWRDVTDRKEAEAALRKSEEKYRALFESMDQAYAVVEVLKDPAGIWSDFRFLEVNPAFLQHTSMPWPVGRTATELLGSPNPRWAKLYGEALESGRSIRVEESEPALDRVFDLNIIPLDFERSRVAILFSNVTERKRAEAALHESEALRRVALDSGGMGAWTWDTRTNTVRADAVVQKLWGISTDEQPHAVSLYSDLMYPDDVAWLEDIAARDIAAGDEFHTRVQVATGQSSSRWVELRGRADHDMPWLVNGVSFDVTEQRSAEQRLRESEALFRTVAEVIEDLFYVTDVEAGRLEYLSPAYEGIWGRPAAELTADLSRLIETIHPDDRDIVQNAVARQSRGEAAQCEYRIVRPDGEIRWILDRCFPVAIAGRMLSVGVASDVTPRREAEERVRAGEERYRLLLESVRDHAIFTMDKAGLITSWPAGAEAVYGWSEHEIIGRSADLTFLPDDVANGVPQHERDLALGEGWAPNIRWHRHRNGNRIFIDGSTQPLVGADGSVDEFIKIGQDVTAARQTQEALVQSEERLRLALEVGRLAAWDWNLQTDDVRWSDEHFRMQGYAVGEIEPSYEAWAVRVHDDDRPGTEAALQTARDGGTDYAHEFRSLHPDGTIRWLSAYGRFFRDERGLPLRMVGAMIDVTDRREWAERQKVMVAELQHRTRNLIAVVRSIAQQTMAQTGPTEAFRDEFSHRMEALARVQGLLSRSDEEPITIESLIRLELDALGASVTRGKIGVEGPQVQLRHSVVQTLALALHELATDALKYGALGNGQGRLQIAWRTYADAHGERLVLEWIESGGITPERDKTLRWGYGRELIERALPYSLNAQTSFAHDEAGLRCTIDMPLQRTRSRRSAQ